jgi:thymidylate kinase
MLTKLMPPSDLSISLPDQPGSLLGLRKLFEALAAHHVRYCHWKSNLRLDRSLLGRTDLDLLIDRSQVGIFRRILHEQDIKPFHAAPGRHYPAVENYLGFDEETGRLFHLHVHYQLVLGEQFVKNYRLPLEDQFLDSAQVRYDVKVPSPELELIVLSIRVLLKYRVRDMLRDILPFRSPGISADFRREIQWLMAQTDRERILQTLEKVSGTVPGGPIMEFLEIALTGRKADLKLYFLRNRIRRTLSLFQRTNPLSALVRYFVELWVRRRFLRSSPITKMTLPAGGLTIALIGADGAGKSTLCKEMAQWLSWKLDTRIFYLGSKQPSTRSKLLHFLYRMIRRGHRTISGVLGGKNFVSRLFEGFQDVFLHLHYVSLGQDRYQRYLAGMKKAMAGSVVIFDRYPLESINPQIGAGGMDSSKISVTAGGSGGAVARILARTEKALYAKIHLPDYLAILNVSPAVSLKRKPDHKPDVVEAKSQLIGRLTALAESDAKGLRTIHLDADLPFEEVFLQLKRKVWEIL